MGDTRFYVSILVAVTAIFFPTPSATADLLEVEPGFPLLVFDGLGATIYDAATNEYNVDADAVSIRFTPETPPRKVVPTGPNAERFVRLRILVDNDGMLIGGQPGPDLMIVGAVDADGDGTIDFEGTLLTGSIIAFGFLDGPAANAEGGTDEFDFQLRLNGGALAGLYAGADIGVVNTSDSSTFDDFTMDFGGGAEGSIGPIAPIGACCLPDDTCVDAVTQDDCEAGGGFFGGRESMCLSIECPGACCLPDESCTFVTRAECAASGGDFRGEGSVCEDVDCRPPGGACCFDDGSCLVRTQDECRDEGGAYQGNGTTCIPGLCPAPGGACCFPNGACFVLTQEDCGEQGGLFQGRDVECIPELCPPPKGACCRNDGTCFVTIETECVDAGGHYQGDDSICEPGLCDIPTGACCFDDGSCLLTTQRECLGTGGTYQGSGSECLPDLCPQRQGACCLDNDECVILSREACEESGGEYQGDGIGCTPDTLGEPGRYRLANHPDGNRAPPLYGARFDELFDVTGETDVFTFDFDAPGAEMLLDYDGTRIRIHGTAFGGLDDGDDYDPSWISFVEMDFTYTVVESAPGDDDLIVTTPSGTNSGTITWLETGEVIEIEDKSGDLDFSFRFGDEDDDAGHRGFPGLSGWGWLMDADGPRDGSQDWIFTVRGICEGPQPGACCLTDGDCVIADAEACDEMAGEFQGEGTECRPETCRDDGACCLPDEDCSTGDFECDRKIVRMTMIWDGNGPVRIRAYDGDVGSELLADIDNIAVGDEVTIGPLDGPNNSEWEIFEAGTDNLIGLSEFHRSCSDQDMNGPEDCGEREGNGKGNDDDLINDWILEGLVDGRGDVFDCGLGGGGNGCIVLSEDECTAAGGTFQGGGTTCEDVDCSDPVGACCLSDHDDDCADLTRFCCEMLGGLYLGDGTSCETSECFDCDGKIVEMTMIWDGDEPVRIRAYDGNVDRELLADIDNIAVGDEVTVGPLDGPNDSYWEIFEAGTDNLLGRSKFHRSCSDREMDGAEDCGRRQGNGKSNEDGLINDWILEGLVDEDGGVLDCGG